MKNILLLTAGLLAFLICITPTKAQAFDSFGFYCRPYTKTFEDGKHYIPADSTATSSGQCWFQIPSDLAANYSISVGVYKGAVGNAQPLFGGSISSFFPFDATAYNHLGATFSVSDVNGNLLHPKQDDDFFAVVYDAGINDTNGSNPISEQFQKFFAANGTAPNDHYKIIKWKWGAKPPSEWDPVVIIPGILGSWQNPLTGNWVIDPINHTYDNLIETLKSNGYVQDKTLFTFPYDWEQSNVTSAQQLAQKISNIKALCGCSQVDLIAHSMGGLVATQYIESTDYKDDVDQLIMLGTPLAGAPKIYSAWEAGTINLGSPLIDVFLQGIFSQEATSNGYDSVFNFIHQKPIASVQELLPIFQNYLKQGSTVLQFPTGYPTNPFLQNLVGDPSNYYNKVLNKVQMYVVVGEKGTTSTAVGYQIKNSTQLPLWQDGEPTATIAGEGDATVPFDSAIMFSGPEKELRGVKHMDLPTAAAPYIFTQLTGNASSTVVSIPFNLLNPYYLVALSKLAPQPKNFAGYIETIRQAFPDDIQGHILLFITLFSPIDVRVTAPDGKQIGIDFTSHNVINQTSNAVYSGPIGEHEYVVIEDPLPGQYKVETIGTGNGTYTVAAGLISQATTTASLVSGTTTLNQVISNTLFVSSTSTSITLTPPLAATSTPTTTPLTPETCAADMSKAYKDKWIGKKAIVDNLMLDCKALKPLFAAQDRAKTTLARNLAIAAIKLIIADMELLAKDKGNTKDAVSLITKYAIWFKNQVSL